MAHESDYSPDPPVEFGDSLQWSEVDEAEEQRRADDPERRRRVRLLIGACIVGGLVIVVLTVFGVRALVSDLDENNRSKVDVIGEQYDKQYGSCVRNGSSERACADRTSRACVNDGRWDDDETSQILQACDFSRKAG